MVMPESHIHNIPMEQCVLVALMTFALSYELIAQDLDEGCFYPERHKQIYNAIVELANENQPYDVVMVEQRLKSKNLLHVLGGEQYLKIMLAEAPSSFHSMEPYITQLKNSKHTDKLSGLDNAFRAWHKTRLNLMCLLKLKIYWVRWTTKSKAIRA